MVTLIKNRKFDNKKLQQLYDQRIKDREAISGHLGFKFKLYDVKKHKAPKEKIATCLVCGKKSIECECKVEVKENNQTIIPKNSLFNF